MYAAFGRRRDGSTDEGPASTSRGPTATEIMHPYDEHHRVELGSGWNAMRSLTGVGAMNGDKIPGLITVANSTGQMYLYAGKASGLGARTLQGSGWNS
jgi:hypothetical protein